MTEFLFWSAIIAVVYTYIGYPLFLVIIDMLMCEKSGNTRDESTNTRPTVSIVIAAYNEEKVIDDKINNCIALEYPSDLLDIWIASDGSSDRTNEIVRSHEKLNKRVHLLQFPRTGKSGVLNGAMTYVKSDVVVFSDANTEFSTDALKKLIPHLSDINVGCVCGRLIYRNPGEAISGKGESFYWRYETALKKMESRLGYVAGANGAIYAIRRKLFEVLPAKTINDDFMISMRIVKRGLKCIYEENAIAYENVAPSVESEFRRHLRDGAGHYRAVLHLLGLLNPFLGMRSFIYWSHRILRWSAPFFLIFIFSANIYLLNSVMYKNIFMMQLGFYLMAFMGLISLKSKKLPFFLYIPFYFCNLNLALLMGFFKALTGSQKTTWERTERTG